IVALQVLETKRGVVVRESSGIRVWILVGNLGEPLQSVLDARGLIGIDGRAEIGRIRSRANAALVSLHADIEDGCGFQRLAIDIKIQAAITERNDQRDRNRNKS